MPPEVRERAKKALQRLGNGVLDPQPTLVLAQLIRSVRESDRGILQLVVVDEELDLRGLRVKEQHKAPDGGWVTMVEESYPLYAGDELAPPTAPFAPEEIVPVHIRSKGKVKDEDAWRLYTIQALDELVRRLITPTVIEISDGKLALVQRKKASTRDENVRDVSPRNGPHMEMPPIWISALEPNEVRVFISVYDRVGNVSETVEMYDVGGDKG